MSLLSKASHRIMSILQISSTTFDTPTTLPKPPPRRYDELWTTAISECNRARTKCSATRSWLGSSGLAYKGQETASNGSEDEGVLYCSADQTSPSHDF